MTEIVLLPNDVGAALSLQELAHSWRGDALTPETARNLELLVNRAAAMAKDLQGIWAVCTQEGSVWEADSYFRRVRVLEFLAFTVVDILTRAQEIVARMQAEHPEWIVPRVVAEIPPSLGVVRAVLDKAQELLKWLSRPKPPVPAEMIRRAQDSLSRGEGETVSDLIARLEGGAF